MHFAGAPPDEPVGKTDCCGFNVYGVVVKIDRSKQCHYLQFAKCIAGLLHYYIEIYRFALLTLQRWSVRYYGL